MVSVLVVVFVLVVWLVFREFRQRRALELLVREQGWRLDRSTIRSAPVVVATQGVALHCFSNAGGLRCFNVIEGEYRGRGFVACEVRNGFSKGAKRDRNYEGPHRIVCLVDVKMDAAPFYLMRANVFSRLGMRVEDAVEESDYRVLACDDAEFDEMVLLQGKKGTQDFFTAERRQRLLDNLGLLKKGARSLVIGGHKAVFYSRQELYSVQDLEAQIVSTIALSQVIAGDAA